MGRASSLVRMTMTATALLGVLGCGSSDNKTGGAFSSSVPGSAPLNTLTPAQTSTLCKELGTYVEGALKPLTCQLGGFTVAAFSAIDPRATDAELKKACEDATAECLQQQGSPDGGASGAGMCDPIPANCTATVAEMSACITDSANALKQSASAIPTCASITRASLSSDAGAPGGGEPPEPASCKALSAKCPSLNVTGGEP
ncbi:MAG TPA: hypothetical protein VGG33_01805 [Polyangia bacterium]